MVQSKNIIGGNNVTLDELNKFIKELVRNGDFKELLNPNNNGEIKFALDINN